MKPLADAGVTIIDWSILSTGAHNCRTRHHRLPDPAMEDRTESENSDLADKAKWDDRQAIPLVIAHCASEPLDPRDVVVKHGHARGLKFYGSVRLNHANATVMLEEDPGRQFGEGGSRRMDFGDPVFHDYLLEVYEDLLAKVMDGLSLDFERNALFFPDSIPQAERTAACRRFLRRVRALTDKPFIARVAYDAAKGGPQGQEPKAWIREELPDAVVPATHNHEPEDLAWSFDRFVEAS